MHWVCRTLLWNYLKTSSKALSAFCQNTHPRQPKQTKTVDVTVQLSQQFGITAIWTAPDNHH